MKEHEKGLYRVSEFAVRAGVTVRALHHYDRLGLLRPTGRTGTGYRLYGERDLARLQQIVTLKFIGFPLNQIKEILDNKTFDLRTALQLQRQTIDQRRRHLEKAVKAIENAERALSAVARGGEPEWDAFKKIIEVINMQNNTEWMNKYYSDEARQKLADRAVPQGAVEQAQQDWAVLIKEVETAVASGEDPGGPHAQQLAERWSTLIKTFTGGDPEVTDGLKKLYADKPNWPAGFKKPYSDEAGAFICQAAALHMEK